MTDVAESDEEKLMDALFEATEAAEDLGHQQLANRCGELYQRAGRMIDGQEVDDLVI